MKERKKNDEKESSLSIGYGQNWWFGKRRGKEMNRDTSLTKVSVGICAYNEGGNIAILLENLLTEQMLPSESEIIVVCSGCTDKTPEIVQSFCKRDERVKLIVEKERRGKSSAVNIVLAAYSGECLFLIPADVVPAQFALRRMVDKMSSNPAIGVVSGRPVPVNRDSGFLGYLVNLMWRMHHRTLEYLDDRNMNTHASGELMLMRKGIVSEIPLDIINDDAYISIEAFSNNLIVKYCEDAVVYIKAPSSIADFIRQRRRVVYGHHRVKQVTEYRPQVLEGLVFRSPRKFIDILKEEIRERPRDIPRLFLAISIEALVNFLAMMDIVLKKEHTVWKIAESTKSSIREGKK